MKYVIEIPSELLDGIRRAVEGGQMTGIVDFVRTAIENQVALEEMDEGPLGEPGTAVQIRESSQETRTQTPRDVWSGLRSRDMSWKGLVTTRPMDVKNVPLWGQYNRLFPVKLGLRALARELESSEIAIDLKSFHASASETAVRVRNFLREVDQADGKRRTERLSAALPRETDKSRRRFQSHFLGYLQRDGTPVGALPELGLLTISAEQGNSVNLTEAGLRFAALPNPIIDDSPPYRERLGQDEINFIIHHFKEFLPAEFEFLLNVLRWISEGAENPRMLHKRVRQAYPDWSDKVANSMRTGLLGRMYDLGLISRERDGRKITYKLLPKGKELMREREGEAK